MTVRYLIKFTKESDIKFISHLDLTRTIQRTFRRTELPTQFSKGFNPHMNISLTQPLSVGMYSRGDYMDAEFEERVNEKVIKDKFNENAPDGIKILDVIEIQQKENEKKMPQSMALLDVAEYTIKIKYKDTKKLKDEIEKILEMPEMVTLKKSKKGEKEVNIKLYIKKFQFNIESEFVIIKCMVACGSKENLSADLLANYIINNTSNYKEGSFVDICREEMYVDAKGKLIPMYQFVRS